MTTLYMLATYDSYYPSGPEGDIRFVGTTVKACQTALDQADAGDNYVEIYQLVPGSSPTLLMRYQGPNEDRAYYAERRIGRQWVVRKQT